MGRGASQLRGETKTPSEQAAKTQVPKGSHPTGLDVTASVARNVAVVGKGVNTFGHMIADPLGSKIVSVGQKTLPALGKLALPLTIAAAGTAAVLEGYKGYQKNGAIGAAKGAVRGAADSMTLGLASWAYNKVAHGGSSKPGENIPDQTTKTIVAWAAEGKGGRSSLPSLSGSEAQSFSKASKTYEAKRQSSAPPDKPQSTPGRRGFQNPKVQAAAQRAKGNNYTGPEE